jgi:hypothetical protein
MPIEAAERRELLVSLTSTVPSLPEAPGYITDARPAPRPGDLLSSAGGP